MDEHVALALHGAVAVVTMSHGENAIDPEFLDAWDRILDTVIVDPSVSTMVTVGTGKFWSTGLDLVAYRTLDGQQRITFMQRFDLLLGRLLVAPIVTIAALNGHTYAGGALWALAHDYRIMRNDRGYFCLPSVDVGIPFSPGMSALITAKLPQPIGHDLVVSGRRIGGGEAAATGVVHRAVRDDEVLPVALRLAEATSGKDPATLHTVKRRLYPEAADMLTREG